MAISQFPQKLLYATSVVTFVATIALLPPAVSKEVQPTGRCALTSHEMLFTSTALEISRLLHDNRITCKDFRNIFETHKQWESDRNIEKSKSHNRNIGIHTEDTQTRLLHERHFNGADLRGLDMAWVDLTGVHLNGANITGSGTRAKRVPGIPKFLHDIDLSHARLTGAQIGYATAKEALLRFSLLIGVDFKHTDLRGAVLYGSDLRWASFSNSILTDADFFETDL